MQLPEARLKQAQAAVSNGNARPSSAIKIVQRKSSPRAYHCVMFSVPTLTWRAWVGQQSWQNLREEPSERDVHSNYML